MFTELKIASGQMSMLLFLLYASVQLHTKALSSVIKCKELKGEWASDEYDTSMYTH
jgi:hypothetical protein